MPNRKTHQLIGAVAGTALGLHRVHCRNVRIAPEARDEFGDAVQVFGTALLGAAFAGLPDVLEPATSPRHRSHAHRWVAGGGATLPLAAAAEWEDKCRAAATYCRDQAAEAWQRGSFLDALLAILFKLGEVACCLGAALPAGIVAGYCSHIVADARTPAGVPIV